MAYGSCRALTEDEKAICRENGIDPAGKSVALAGDDFLLLLHHKTRDYVRVSFGEARMRERKGGKN